MSVLSDNINRTKSSMNVLFRKGQLGAPGSVSWDFNHVGMIEAGVQNFESADAVVDMPIDNLPVEIILKIMAGGAAMCQSAGSRSPAYIETTCQKRSTDQ